MAVSGSTLAPFLEGAELLGVDQSTGCHIFKAELRHLPLFVPLVIEYYKEDPFCRETGVKVGEDHAWPLAYNGLRYPTSCFGVIKEEVVCITLGLLETKDIDVKLLREADVHSCFGENDPFRLLDELENQFRHTVFDTDKTDRCVVEDISYVRKSFRGLKLANFSNICFNRLCMKYSSNLKISRCYGLITSKPSLSSFRRVGYEVIQLISDDLYVGNPAFLLKPEGDGMDNAAVVRLDFEQAKKEKPEFYGNCDGIFVYSEQGSSQSKYKNKL